MKAAQDIIIRPVITEKATDGIADKKYTFVVAKDANKYEIKKAVEELFKVTVAKVTTVNQKSKPKRLRMGAPEGKTAAYKKAYVLLAEDSKTIEFFDGMM